MTMQHALSPKTIPLKPSNQGFLQKKLVRFLAEDITKTKSQKIFLRTYPKKKFGSGSEGFPLCILPCLYSLV